MIEEFKNVIYKLVGSWDADDSFSLLDPVAQFNSDAAERIDIAGSLNAAFLISLAGKRHPLFDKAESFITGLAKTPEWKTTADLFLAGRELIEKEIEQAAGVPEFSNSLMALNEYLSDEKNASNKKETVEKIWSVFFPEAVGVFDNHLARVNDLRSKRVVRITRLNSLPLTDPGRQLLFTSNILLTVPASSTTPDKLGYSRELKKKVFKAAVEEQAYYYDHPIQIGVKPDQNEILYGLGGLNEAMEFERLRGNLPGGKATCVLSASVTHKGLQSIAGEYIQEESKHTSLENLDIYVFTEADTNRIVEHILVPAAENYLATKYAKKLLQVFGVDGEYGRHYSFLKAISAFWNVLIDPEVKATFKIDLDQVFPQNELVEQTGASLFEHFATPLWGAEGLDFRDEPVELGMIAGTLVNERDIHKGIFFPDVLFPAGTLSQENHFFHSRLLMALSTEAEMMTRYTKDGIDGKKKCIQRIHVTGGTNGILVESLFRHRPFTPSFMGRAEDQAYILSVLKKPGRKLAYAHKDGLVMRHDKEAFAADAIKAASFGKMIGDYIRILYFSEYAGVLTGDISELKELVDPFTGCFISKIPITEVFIRFCLKAASFFLSGQKEMGANFITKNSQRLADALDFVKGENSPLKKIYELESLGWDIYYDTLPAIESALRDKDPFAVELGKKAKEIVDGCKINV